MEASLAFVFLSAAQWLSTNWWDVAKALWPLAAFLVTASVGVAAWMTLVAVWLRRSVENDKVIISLIQGHRHKPVAEDGTGGEVVFDADVVDIKSALGTPRLKIT